MFNKLKLNVKLIGAFSIVAIITLVVGFIGWSGVRSVQDSLLKIGEIHIVKVENLEKIHSAQMMIKATERTLLIKGLDGERIGRQSNNFDIAWNTVDECWTEYEVLPRDKEGEELCRNFINLWNEYKKGMQSFILLSDKYQSTLDEEIYEQMNQHAFTVNYNNFNSAEAALNKMIDYVSEAAENEVASSKSESQMVILWTVVAMVLGTLLALSLGIALSIMISKPILVVVNGLNESAAQVSSASEQLSATSQQLAEGNSEQASSLEETSSTLEEASSMVYQNSENTKQAAALAAQARIAADKGNAEMEEMMDSINEIKKSSDEISRIIKVIDEIAFLTNILALNAAVEAARAGDAGMGFAVVAEEVRTLAQRSAQAAKDTSELIERNIEMSNMGVDVSKRVGDALLDITTQAKKVNELMDEVSAASQEQTQGITQINKALSQMETVTQNNASNAEESASTAEELSSQALNLQEIVKELATLVNGHSNNDTAVTNYKSNEYKQNLQKKYTGTLTHSNNPKAMKTDTNPKTHIVSPEDVIPLEDDKLDF